MGLIDDTIDNENLPDRSKDDVKKNRIIIKSFVITVVYFLTANIYFFAGFINPISESSFRQTFEAIFTLPAIITFGVGFGSGSSWGYFASLIIFLVIWSIILGLTSAYYFLKNEKRNRKPTA